MNFNGIMQTEKFTTHLEKTKKNVFVSLILKRHAQKPCTPSPMRVKYSVAKNFAKQYKIESSPSEDDLLCPLSSSKRQK